MYRIFNIRKIRESKGFSQEYMANRLGISQSAYCKMEMNVSKIAFENILKITDVLKITKAEVLGTVRVE